MPTNIAYIQTPFHASTFRKVLTSGAIEKSGDWLIYYDPALKQEADKYLGNLQVSLEEAPEFRTNQHYGFVKQFIEGFKTGANIRKFRKAFTAKQHIDNFVFFSEKNIFSQLALSILPPTTKVWAIDEGAAYYVKPMPGDDKKKVWYPIVSAILLQGFPYQFYRTFGSHPRVDNLVLRFPKLRPPHTSNATVFSFEQLGIDIGKKLNINAVLEAKKVIVLTSVLYQYYQSFSLLEELKLFSHTIETLLSKGYHVDIKPHPAEDYQNKYKNFIGMKGVSFIPASTPSEELNYENYAYILLHYSSAILDLLSTNYPIDRIINLNFSDEHHIDNLFQEVHYACNINQLAEYVHPV